MRYDGVNVFYPTSPWRGATHVDTWAARLVTYSKIKLLFINPPLSFYINCNASVTHVDIFQVYINISFLSWIGATHVKSF